MIVSFRESNLEEFFYDGKLPKKGCGWTSKSSIITRKLDMLNAAVILNDLRSPPSNRLEALRGDLDGFYRVNDQWRVVFQWTHEGPADVYITDYH